MDQFYHDWKQRILDAHQRIRSTIVETPVETAIGFTSDVGTRVIFKMEHQQRTGSFKMRGAANKMALLSPEQAKAGVTTASAGNHGLAVAASAQALGIPAQIYVSSRVAADRVARIKAYGVEMLFGGDEFIDAELAARRAAQEMGKVFVSPYNDPDVVAGQGTISVELKRQCPPMDAIFVAAGGGGLICGIGAYLKAVSPHTQIIGCWPENSPVLWECMKAGQIIDVPEQPTLSESTAGGIEPGAITLDLAKKVIDRSILVSEDEILSAMRKVRDVHGWVIEGAAGVAVAAFLKQAHEFEGKTVVILLCGGNPSNQVRARLQ